MGGVTGLGGLTVSMYGIWFLVRLEGLGYGIGGQADYAMFSKSFDSLSPNPSQAGLCKIHLPIHNLW